MKTKGVEQIIYVLSESLQQPAASLHLYTLLYGLLMRLSVQPLIQQLAIGSVGSTNSPNIINTETHFKYVVLCS